eukprot:3100321-Amphidinium_carterae.2
MVYLDDVSISGPSATLLARSFALAGTFLWNWGVQLNLEKSSVAMVGDVGHVPAAMGELRKVSSFKLLGVNSGPNPCDSLLKARLVEASARLDRIALLAPPMNMVRSLVAAFVVPVLYGCSFSACQFSEWKQFVARVH